ncbi:MAG: ChbG/HpnK family deacetylase [Bacteroidota bacterium]
MNQRFACVFLLLFSPLCTNFGQTYAERMSWKSDDQVIIMHVDDVSMSYDSNQRAIKAIDGIAHSVRVMMHCPWASSFIRYAKENPEVDAGLHLTLTAEWKDYRWELLMEVGAEIRVQVEHAKGMSYLLAYLDSSAGTLFVTESVRNNIRMTTSLEPKQRQDKVVA